MQWFVSGCNSQLSDLHPLKISNILSTTLTQLRRQRREYWVGISSAVEVDAQEKMRFSYDAQRVINKPNWKFPFYSTSKEF